jgi:bifunctional non-homologous end joining protein LigD
MAQIAEGKGRAPKPFMLKASTRTTAAQVWNSSKGLAADARAKKPATAKKQPAKKARVARLQTKRRQERRDQDRQARQAARLHRTATLHICRSTTIRQRLGPRDQIRRLSHPDED